MTEEEWLTCPDPQPMLRFLFTRKASQRKLGLFAVACVRRVWHLLGDDNLRTVLDIAEMMADGRARAQDVGWARARLGGGPLDVLFGPPASAADEVSVTIAARGNGAKGPTWLAERSAQADLLREVFGNPLRPPAALTGLPQEDFVHAMARGIYEDRTFHRLPILADALEDSGCDDTVLLDHVRGPYPHVRGCWAVDFLAERG